MKKFITHNKYLSYGGISFITQLAVLLLAPDYGKVKTFYWVERDHEAKDIEDRYGTKHKTIDLNKDKYPTLLYRGALITAVLTPLAILTDKYFNQNITDDKTLQYLLIAGESVLPFLASPLLSNSAYLLSDYNLGSAIVSSIFQAIICKAILEYQVSEISIEIADDVFTNDSYMNE